MIRMIAEPEFASLTPRRESAATVADILYYLFFTSEELDRAVDQAMIDILVEQKLRAVAMWPPDVFCVAASLLKHSNAYTRSAAYRRAHTRQLKKKAEDWLKSIERGDIYNPIYRRLMYLSHYWRVKDGHHWRSRGKKVIANYEPRPIGIYDHIRRRLKPISTARADEDIVLLLLSLLSIADLASEGFGLRPPGVECPSMESFVARARADWLVQPGMSGSSLCRTIPTSRARVLPKTHTPGRGLSMRSLSHYLCYLDSDQGNPLWFTVPSFRPRSRSIQILLVPFPYKIREDAFEAHETALGPNHYHFRYLPQETMGDCVGTIVALCVAAEKDSGRKVDVVLMPELSLGVTDYRLLRDALLDRGTALIAGVGGPTQENLEQNRVCIDLPIGDFYRVHMRQKKHHFWQMDGPQILQYKLAGSLDPTKRYWESFDIGERHICFLELHPLLLTSILICEDLSQYEPVGRMIRAVGPNLVIALLMDAPQVRGRWPERYAAVLSDDPGCSVLTLTCVGMNLRSKQMDESKDKSKTVALWKDPLGELRELELESGAEAIAIDISFDERAEWTYDLRERMASVPRLAGIRQIRPSDLASPPVIGKVLPRMVPRVELSPCDISALSTLAWMHERSSLFATEDDTSRLPHILQLAHRSIRPRLSRDGQKIADAFADQIAAPTRQPAHGPLSGKGERGLAAMFAAGIHSDNALMIDTFVDYLKGWMRLTQR